MKNKKRMIHFAIYILLCAVILVTNIRSHNKIKELEKKVNNTEVRLVIEQFMFKEYKEAVMRELKK